jgi:predicted nucleic acid-binding protein
VSDATVTHLRGILDTSTVIMLSRITDPATLPVEPLITAVTLAELSVGSLVANDADFEPLPFDAASARAFGRVAAAMRRAGRKPSARAYDAMIAATAVANQLPVFTCNPEDFTGIDELTVVAVPVPAAGERR